jgi:hypothetical protein
MAIGTIASTAKSRARAAASTAARIARAFGRAGALIPFPVEEKSRLDEIYPEIVELEADEYEGDKQKEEEK